MHDPHLLMSPTSPPPIQCWIANQTRKLNRKASPLPVVLFISSSHNIVSRRREFYVSPTAWTITGVPELLAYNVVYHPMCPLDMISSPLLLVCAPVVWNLVNFSSYAPGFAKQSAILQVLCFPLFFIVENRFRINFYNTGGPCVFIQPLIVLPIDLGLSSTCSYIAIFISISMKSLLSWLHQQWCRVFSEELCIFPCNLQVLKRRAAALCSVVP